jgi:apoptosis-inducing factor 2
MARKKKVVVIGGGFAGSHAAKKLDKNFDVTLIDTKDYFEFTPGVLRTIVEPEHVRKIQVLHSHYLKWAKIIVGKVNELGENYVKVKRKKIKFDYLIIASGSSYDAPFKEQNIVTATRGRNLRNHYDALCKAERVLIIGGGIVGVELAGEILWKYGNEKEITIVHSGKRLIARNGERAINFAESYLRKRGVKIICGERVIKKKSGDYITNVGRKLEGDIVFLCTGIVPNYKFMKGKFKHHLNERNQVRVNDHLQLHGMKNIFAIGDVGDRVEEKTAQNAERQADVMVKNICALEKGKLLVKYCQRSRPLLISLGKHAAIYCGEKIIISGWIPSLMKAWIERWEMWKKRQISDQRFFCL